MVDGMIGVAKRAAIRAVALMVACMAVLAASPDARACGVSGVGGQASSACALAQPESNRVSVGYTFTSTALSFDGDRRADVMRHAVSASMTFPLGKRLVLEGALGALAGGSLSLNGVDYNYNPGFLVGASATYMLVTEGKRTPLVLASATLAALFASTSSRSTSTQDFDALDLRVGASAGKHLTDDWTLFVVGRAFGGPVYWHVDGVAVTGTDRYHYQVGLGSAYALGPAFVFIEGVPLGERAFSVGAGSSF